MSTDPAKNRQHDWHSHNWREVRDEHGVSELYETCECGAERLCERPRSNA